MSNIYNAIQNLYNMDKKTWQEVLAELYNVVSNIENKFDLFEIKFGPLLGEQVTRELKKMYDNGSLASLINDVLLKDINKKVDNNYTTLDTKINTVNTELSSQLDNKFKGREKMNLSWEMNGIGTTGQNNTIVTRIRTVDYYNFDENIVITPDSGYKYAIFIYDENKSFLTYEWFNETKEIIIDKKYFYRFCIANTNDTTANLSYKDNVKIERYYQLPSLNELINSRIPNRWYGKKLIIIGDSISDDNYNSALSFVWTKGVRDYFGFWSYENYAIASSTIAVKESNPEDRTPLVTRYQEMSDDGDLIIVSAITNDWFYQWTPIGTMESRDIYTLYGALHTLCLGLKKKYKGKTIKFLTGIMRRQNDRQTPHATNGLGKSLVYYNNIVKEVCGYYSIPVIDMFENCGLYPFDDELALEYYNQQGSEGNYYTLIQIQMVKK